MHTSFPDGVGPCENGLSPPPSPVRPAKVMEKPSAFLASVICMMHSTMGHGHGGGFHGTGRMVYRVSGMRSALGTEILCSHPSGL